MNKTIDMLELKDNADYIMAGTGTNTHRLSIDSIVQAVKKSAGYDRVLEKCPACGQWGAVMCECPKCGHPIDPKE